MIPLEEAQRVVLDECNLLPPRSIPLGSAAGCVASETVVATEPVPPFANSAMDGYAVRAADTQDAPIRLTVIGSIMAGHTLDRPLGPGQAARIMTGAPVPTGADAVCMIEETEPGDDAESVVIRRHLQPGDFVRNPGRDVAVGDVLLGPGTELNAAALGVLANQGIHEVMARPRPHVGVLSTGDELAVGDGPLAPGQIRDANRHTLLALVRREGWDATDLGVVGDDENELMTVLGDAARTCDAIVSSGGVSVGDLDLFKVVLEKLCTGSMRWMQVAIRPAKPFAFGVLSEPGTPVFGLPGNPVSAMVSFELFVRPTLRRMGGHMTLHRSMIPAQLESDLAAHDDGKLHFLRGLVTLDRSGVWRVRTASGQESHHLHAMSQGNALVLHPAGPAVPAGDTVTVMLIDPGRIPQDTPAGFATPTRAGIPS